MGKRRFLGFLTNKQEKSTIKRSKLYFKFVSQNISSCLPLAIFRK